MNGRIGAIGIIFVYFCRFDNANFSFKNALKNMIPKMLSNENIIKGK